MYWLKVNKSFYNLELITKISYFRKNNHDIGVEIFYSGVNKAEKLKGTEAARFLDAISRQDGCWAFTYPVEDAEYIQSLLRAPQLKKSTETEMANSSTEKQAEEDQ